MTLELLHNITAGADISDDEESLRRIEDWASEQEGRLDTLEGDTAVGATDVFAAEQTDSFTLDTGMLGQTVPCNKSSTMVATIPTNDNQNFPVGARVKFIATGAGGVQVAAAATVTLDYVGDSYAQIKQQWGQVTLVQIAVDHWVLFGDLYHSIQDVIAAGAISVYAKHVKVVGPATSTYAMTLAAPAKAGILMIIEMISTTGTNAVTLALTNVIGGTASSSASFDAARETLILLSLSDKWLVMKQQGVTLS